MTARCTATLVVLMAFAPAGRAQCPSSDQLLGLLSPHDGDAIPLTPEFRFFNQVARFLSLQLVALDGAEGPQNLHGIDGSDTTLVVDRPLRAGVAYELWAGNPDQCEDCADWVATFTAVDEVWPAPPAPSVVAVSRVEEWSVTPCYEFEALNFSDGFGTDWVVVAFDDDGGEATRPELSMRFLDPETGTTREVVALPPGSFIDESPGAILSAPGLDPAAEVTLEAAFVNIDGERGASTTFIGPVPERAFSGCASTETSTGLPGGGGLALVLLAGRWGARRRRGA